jgi:hypothetical protein
MVTFFFRGALSLAPAGLPFFFGSTRGVAGSTIGSAGSSFSRTGSTIGSTIASAIFYYRTFLQQSTNNSKMYNKWRT